MSIDFVRLRRLIFPRTHPYRRDGDLSKAPHSRPNRSTPSSGHGQGGFGTGICVYCGRGDAPTIGEHIFGRQLFLTRHRDRLPKVPSCEACNTTKSQLENYFMAITPLGANHPTAKEYAELNLPRRFAGNRRLHRSMVESLGRGDNGRLAYAAELRQMS